MGAKIQVEAGAVLIVPEDTIRSVMSVGIMVIEQGAFVATYPPMAPLDFIEWMKTTAAVIASERNRSAS